MRSRQQLFVLKLTHNDSRCDSKFFSKFLDAGFGQAVTLCKGMQHFSWNEFIFGERIGFILFVGIKPVHPLQKQLLFPMQQDVTGLVKKSKPQVVIGLVAQT